MRWPIKCFIDSCKALLPFQRQLRRLKHRMIPFEEPAGVDRGTVQEGLSQIQWLREAGHVIGDSTVMEIGPGWQPVIPLLFSIAGAREVVLVDAHSLLSAATFQRAISVLLAHVDAIATHLRTSRETVRGRLTERAGTLEELLKAYRLTYLAPCDACSLPLENTSVDLIVSRAVLEHISPSTVACLMRECRRVLKPSGAMCHLIDNSDHWAHRDSRISLVNFLKFSDVMWRFTGINPQNYQNRLRHSQYAALLHQTGFVIKREDRRLSEASLQKLSSIRLAARFRTMQPDDLACTESFFLAEPPVS